MNAAWNLQRGQAVRSNTPGLVSRAPGVTLQCLEAHGGCQHRHGLKKKITFCLSCSVIELSKRNCETLPEEQCDRLTQFQPVVLPHPSLILFFLCLSHSLLMILSTCGEAELTVPTPLLAHSPRSNSCF